MSVKTQLLDAIQNGNLSEVKRMIGDCSSKTRLDVNVKFQDNTTPLYNAYKFNQPAIIDYLKSFQNTVETAAKIAIQQDDFSLFQRILDVQTIKKMGPDVIKDLIISAQADGKVSMSNYLKSQNAEVFNELMIRTVQQGKTNHLKYFLQLGGDVNYCDTSKASLLHHAAANGHFDTVKFLIGNGAAVMTQGTLTLMGSGDKKLRGTPAGMAEQCGHRALANFLKSAELNLAVDLIQNFAQLDMENLQEAIMIITDHLQKTSDDKKRQTLSGYLYGVFEQLPFTKSAALYRAIAPQTNKNIQENLQHIIRENRAR